MHRVTLLPRAAVTAGNRISPADRLISELDGIFYKLTEAAEIVGVSSMSLRRLLKNPDVKAPTYQIERGKMTVYIYTEQDIQELTDYYSKSRVPVKRG
jgi:hypothetical protein